MINEAGVLQLFPSESTTSTNFFAWEWIVLYIYCIVIILLFTWTAKKVKQIAACYSAKLNNVNFGVKKVGREAAITLRVQIIVIFCQSIKVTIAFWEDSRVVNFSQLFSTKPLISQPNYQHK